MIPAESRLKRLLKAHKALQVQADEYEKTVKETFPVGCKVEYQHGDHMRTATIVEHGYGTRMSVGGVTGKVYWIDAHRFFDYMK